MMELQELALSVIHSSVDSYRARGWNDALLLLWQKYLVGDYQAVFVHWRNAWIRDLRTRADRAGRSRELETILNEIDATCRDDAALSNTGRLDPAIDRLIQTTFELLAVRLKRIDESMMAAD
jgi:hypothetical protein